ncbi:TetR/AcrR family transcriptional regulator [Mycolicibacterium sp. 141076]|uniref:TetR/AcrR family transcriptional regulator n=1 Tax=Mycobacteriaceae TaxID=1762 RepID=UPI00299E1B8B|nr:TetR/AcrR family transcriptional regulator [Mycolicibacterium sp. 141076]MDX1880827.1 TetR/AcrR family transcriptional regulator [Mycolicibacterium sp. 141076]
MPAPISDEQKSRDREALLDAAETLFYERGIQAVGMDDIREAAGIALKRIYGLFATKEELIVAVLRRRDHRWRGRLTDYVEQRADPRERVLAVFDWLGQWFAEPGFRGCAWINAYGELGATSPAVLAEVRAHKQAFHEQIAGWVAAVTGAPPEPLCLLAEGAIVTAAITGDTEAAQRAREASESLLG